jgi:GalNAc-alpha-(1->4)-GalNAc-alpha-(1->3)-diNAcBac-PP-undecaprenol alpha-1,4-N-acetyl-D-galactosaminyltransferase
MSIMANYWASQNCDVTLITLASQDLDWYAVHSRVKRIALNLEISSRNIAEAARHNATRLRNLRRAIRNSDPNVVISFCGETNILTLLASIGMAIPVIVSERVDPRYHPIGAIRHGLRHLLYRRADGLVVQSTALHDWACRFVGPQGVYVIPNPVEKPETGVAHMRLSSGRTVVAMGRLTHQKGFDLLLRAFARCASKHDWSLIIIGEGNERAALEALIAELGLKDRVSLLGPRQNPARILQEADLFVMSSRYEGFPNALLEAMACGMAVISTDCPTGPAEIIRHGVDGLLVEPHDINALATAMERLMADYNERERLGARAVEVTERFGVERVMSMWDSAVQQVSQWQSV